MALEFSGDVRPACLAGTWYPGSAEALRSAVEGYFADAGRPPANLHVKAVIAPHAGYVYSGRCAAKSFLHLSAQPRQRIVIMGPSHHRHFHGVSVPRCKAYQTPLGRVPLAWRDCRELLDRHAPLFQTRPGVHDCEHSIEIELPFLQQRMGDFTILPLVFGKLDRESRKEVVSALQPLVAQAETLVVVSSDFAHYGDRFHYRPFTEHVLENLRALNHKAVSAIQSGSSDRFWNMFEDTGITICGYEPIAVLMDLMAAGSPGRLLDYRTSAEVSADLSNVVCYNAMAFLDAGMPALGRKTRKYLLSLARAAIAAHVHGRPPPEPDHQSMPDELVRLLGNFVTLRKHGALRGCIGHPRGTLPLHKGICENAVASASRDPRFTPVTPAELPEIDIEITVLGPLIPIDSVSEIQLGRHGLYIQKGRRTGLLLPQVPGEMGWNLDQYLGGICRKAGLCPDDWREAELSVFTGQIFSEHQELR